MTLHEHKDEGGRTLTKRDPLQTAAIILGLGAQFFLGAWYAGGMDQRVAALEEERRQMREDAKTKVALDALQTSQIGVIQGDVKWIRESVQRIEDKIPERRR
jgi:hypothetical protein